MNCKDMRTIQFSQLHITACMHVLDTIDLYIDMDSAATLVSCLEEVEAVLSIT